jgi:membrane carboxypeptidase/penicillin-binding protein PbpC
VARPDTRGLLRHVDVCAATGLPASEACPSRKRSAVPHDALLHRVCAVHQPVRGRVAEVWPSTPRDWDLAAPGRAGPLATAPRMDALRIVVPRDGAEYLAAPGGNADRILLRARTDADGPTHWYADGRYLGAGGPQAPVGYRLEPGTHRITCMDARGDTASAEIRVVTPG